MRDEDQSEGLGALHCALAASVDRHAATE
jgi:hypothetical protein